MEMCKFCGGKASFIYKMSGYNVFQCKRCFTSFVLEVPEGGILKNFYSGFKFCADINNLSIFDNRIFERWFLSLGLKENSKMLDVGGGGGFFSYSFERFGFGESCYIDLDEEACKFARQIGIKNVINDDVFNIKEIITEKFDFIYARHLIEHLVDPIRFIDICLELLNDDGVFVLQFPNGASFEYLGYPKLLKSRLITICESNENYTALKGIRTLCSKKISHGIDPIRHLWAITPKGISYYLSNKKVSYKINTAPLTDPVFSPYFNIGTWHSRIKSALVNNTLVKINGGTHLIVTMRK